MQQLAIVARDHSARILDKRDDRVAQGGRLPGRCCDTNGTEESGGNLTIGRTRAPSVLCLKHVAQALTLLERDPPIRRHGRSPHMGRQPQQSLDPIWEVCVH
ncbi:hypothetical protein J2S75_001488 [Ancylobacter polymorphus]|uniref:Uncharacterized protein n=1 Tax=Ancylobacter polymorphus TaxID=223390 RepID=A0ABU0B9G0_9HYPH|nr:hypothetical protein [Ancylobacter polymorphus]